MAAGNRFDHVRAKAPGSITVSLRAGSPREDGCHDVASIQLAVSMYEVVSARVVAKGITVSFAGQSRNERSLNEYRGELAGGNHLPSDSHLTVRAAGLLAELCERPTGVHLTITRRVSAAADMGSGPADAAAALVACDALWGSGFSRDELAKIAADVGAGVPFAVLGGTAVGLGTGDQLTPAISRTPLYWVLVPTAFALPPEEVYRNLDRLRLGRGEQVQEPPCADAGALQAMRAGDTGRLAGLLRNDLQEAALDLAPGLGDVLAAGERCGALAGLISGSGPTAVFLAADETAAAWLAAKLEGVGLPAYPVNGPVSGARLAPDFAT